MAFTVPNFKIDTVLVGFQPVEIEVEETEGELIKMSNGGYMFFNKPKGRVFHVVYGRGRMTPEGAFAELVTKRNSLPIHTIEFTDESSTVTATVIWPGDPPHPVVAPGHIGTFTFDLYEVA